MGQVARVLLVEDHEIMRFGLTQLLDGHRGLSICAAVGDGASAMAYLRTHEVDVVVLDLTLPDCHGIKLIRGLKQRAPQAEVLVLTMHDELRYGERAVTAGAAGYITKSAEPGEIVEAIVRVASGGRYLSGTLRDRLLDPERRRRNIMDSLDALTDRELEIFTLLGEGNSSACVAELLNRSIKTVEAHRENIKRKLGLKSASELIHYAITWVQEGMASGRRGEDDFGGTDIEIVQRAASVPQSTELSPRCSLAEPHNLPLSRKLNV